MPISLRLANLSIQTCTGLPFRVSVNCGRVSCRYLFERGQDKKTSLFISFLSQLNYVVASDLNLFFLLSILKSNQGRKELLSLLKHKRHKEMFLAQLEKKRLRFSPLDMRFHIRDLIGSGHLQTFQTTSGLVVRVSRD